MALALLGVWVNGVCALYWTGDLSSCLSPSDCWERLHLCNGFAFDLDVIVIAGKKKIYHSSSHHGRADTDKNPPNMTHCFCLKQWQRATNLTLQKSSASTSVLASLWGWCCRCFPLNDEGAADGKHLSSYAVIGVVRHQPFSCLWFCVNLHVLQPGFHPNVKWVCQRLVRKNTVAVANRKLNKFARQSE